MRKGELTRQVILDQATRLCSRLGLEGLTIGTLAESLDISKSGVFAHFNSKEALQTQVVEHATRRFVDTVVRPALAAPRGEPRVRALFERFLVWPSLAGLAGCPFMGLSSELDDQPGTARDRLVQAQKDWLGLIANCFRVACAEGHFREDADPEQFAYDLYGIMAAHHHASRLLRDPKADQRARAAFETLVRAARQPSA